MSTLGLCVTASKELTPLPQKRTCLPTRLKFHEKAGSVCVPGLYFPNLGFQTPSGIGEEIFKEAEFECQHFFLI